MRNVIVVCVCLLVSCGQGLAPEATIDAGLVDAGELDSGTLDAGPRHDAGPHDAGQPDEDAGYTEPDAGTDAGDCAPIGADCIAHSTCCSLSCSDIVLGGYCACRENGACRQDSDCCSGICRGGCQQH